MRRFSVGWGDTYLGRDVLHEDLWADEGIVSEFPQLGYVGLSAREEGPLCYDV